MKRIMVFDVAAENGGALTILNQFYQDAQKDKNTEWLFVISKPELIESPNVRVLRYPWIKKSWLHRLYFDYFIAHKLVKEYKPDEVLSLQNLTIPRVNVKQTVYLHQSLPFSQKKFKVHESVKLWVYQNIIGYLIYNSLKNADKVIVQTEWMKNACIQKVKQLKEEDIIVKRPYFDLPESESNFIDRDNLILFYPAAGLVYKNHEVIVQAVSEIVKESKMRFSVVFTINGNENKKIKKLYKKTRKENLPIIFIGHLKITEVYNYYRQSILLFSSYIETVGLPLLEAKSFNAPIIASDTPFSREILHDYDKTYYFNPFDYKDLKDKICSFLDDISSISYF